MRVGNSVRVSEELLGQMNVSNAREMVEMQLVSDLAKGIIINFNSEIHDYAETFAGGRRFNFEVEVFTKAQVKKIKNKMTTALGGNAGAKNEVNNFFREIEND